MSKTFTIQKQGLFRGNYEVFEGETLVASLKARGFLKSRGLADIHGQQLKLVQQGGLVGYRNVILSSPDTAISDIVYKSEMLRASGSVHIAGKQYFYKMRYNEVPGHKRFRSVSYAWFNESQQELMTIPANAKGWVKTARMVQVSDAGEADTNYMLLLILAIFIFDLRDRSNA